MLSFNFLVQRRELKNSELKNDAVPHILCDPTSVNFFAQYAPMSQLSEMVLVCSGEASLRSDVSFSFKPFRILWRVLTKFSCSTRL